jgi:hypothetical protein
LTFETTVISKPRSRTKHQAEIIPLLICFNARISLMRFSVGTVYGE